MELHGRTGVCVGGGTTEVKRRRRRRKRIEVGVGGFKRRRERKIPAKIDMGVQNRQKHLSWLVCATHAFPFPTIVRNRCDGEICFSSSTKQRRRRKEGGRRREEEEFHSRALAD